VLFLVTGKFQKKEIQEEQATTIAMRTKYLAAWTGRSEGIADMPGACRWLKYR
jgi:hypothetical protein